MGLATQEFKQEYLANKVYDNNKGLYTDIVKINDLKYLVITKEKRYFNKEIRSEAISKKAIYIAIEDLTKIVKTTNDYLAKK